MDTVLIFTGGERASQGVLEELPRPDLVVAADSGYDAAVELGFTVDVLVGDMDSIETAELPDHVLVEKHPRDKDETDLEIALSLSVAESPMRLVVVGGSGGRIDHEIATAMLLCSSRWDRADEIDWITARGRGHIIHRRRLLHGDIGATVSLIPVGGDATGVSTKGMRWDLDGETLSHGSTRGVSNEMRAPVADVQVAGGCLLALFPQP